MSDVKTAVYNYASPACRTAFQGFSLPKVTAPGGRLCARALLPSTRLTPTPTRASPASHFVLLTTPPRHPPPYTLLDYAFALIPLVTATLLQPENCNRSYIDPTTRLPILRRALLRDLRVTTSTTPPTFGRKDCHPPPPPVFAPGSASLGSPLLAAAHSHQHVLFRVAIGQDRPIGACLAGFQLGAQTHKAERSAVGPRE